MNIQISSLGKYLFLNFSDETETVLNHRLGKGNIVETKTPHNVHQHSENISTISSTDNESASSKPNQV